MINTILDFLNNLWNNLKRPICKIKGHDMCLTMCMRCWRWFPNEVNK